MMIATPPALLPLVILSLRNILYPANLIFLLLTSRVSLTHRTEIRWSFSKCSISFFLFLIELALTWATRISSLLGPILIAVSLHDPRQGLRRCLFQQRSVLEILLLQHEVLLLLQVRLERILL